MKNRILKLIFLALFMLSGILVAGMVIAQDATPEISDQVDVTFTKWVTTYPNMEGVVGGDVGAGVFTGEALDYYVPGEVVSLFEALYHVNGENHTFTAHLFVWDNVATETAELRGVVIDGWMQGSLVRGTYAYISCPDQTDGFCYEGELHIDVLSQLQAASE
jgi:hypothetical protein